MTQKDSIALTGHYCQLVCIVFESRRSAGGLAAARYGWQDCTRRPVVRSVLEWRQGQGEALVGLNQKAHQNILCPRTILTHSLPGHHFAGWLFALVSEKRVGKYFAFRQVADTGANAYTNRSMSATK